MKEASAAVNCLFAPLERLEAFQNLKSGIQE